MAAIVYVRVSTKHQLGDDHFSLEIQEDKARSYCNFRDITDISVFKDEGKSGRKRDGRQGLENSLNTLQSGDFFIVHSISRLARNIIDLKTICKEITDKGAKFVSLTEEINTATAMGRAMFSMIGVIAELDADLAGERIRGALSLKRQKGEFIGRIPFGYVKDPENHKRIIMTEDHRMVVVEIIRLKDVEKWSWNRISVHFNKTKNTPDGNNAWYPATIKRIYNRGLD